MSFLVFNFLKTQNDVNALILSHFFSSFVRDSKPPGFSSSIRSFLVVPRATLQQRAPLSSAGAAQLRGGVCASLLARKEW